MIYRVKVFAEAIPRAAGPPRRQIRTLLPRRPACVVVRRAGC